MFGGFSCRSFGAGVTRSQSLSRSRRAVFSLASYFVCAIAVPGGPFKLYVRQRSSTFLFSGFQNIRRNLL
jgi:hypothetical protein